MQVVATIDIEGALKKLGATAIGSTEAITRALNKTAITARAQAARSIRDVGYGIKVSSVKGSISIRRATSQDLKAVVTATGRPIPLIAYGARQTSKGVSVNVKNGRKEIAHAFIATMASGHKGVFVRTGNTHKRVVRGGKGSRSGLPIKELFGPSIPTAFFNAKVQDAVKTAIDERFPVVLRQELKYVGVIN
jgi:hypothetical protein